MTMHGQEHDAFPEDPIRALEEALRVARAATHSKRMDTSTQAALQAIIQFGHATVAAMKHLNSVVGVLNEIHWPPPGERDTHP